jgi:phenylacetate-CoA ligase
MRKWLIFLFVILAARVRAMLMDTKCGFKLLFMPGTSGFRNIVGLWKAWYVYEKAVRECPAYAKFIAEAKAAALEESRTSGRRPRFVGVRCPGWFSLVPDFSGVPAMDKPNFIKKHSKKQLCFGGQFPMRNAVIDMSSGSSGKPTSWVRGGHEREAVARMMQIQLRQLLPGKRLLFINAFALGPWATGMMVSASLVGETLLVSVGPDVAKIIEILEDPDFDPNEFTFIIAGYPPFLKMLADSRQIDWKRYNVMAFYGGEGMSEGMRDYLLQSFSKVFGDYGASDLEINIAAESDFTVAIRKLMIANEKLRHRLNAPVSSLPDLGRLAEGLPHVFQYNQLDYVVETSDTGELLITLCRATNVSPRIRYNIHDNGHVMSYRQLLRILEEEGIDTKTLPPVLANLPIMFLYGRSDLAASYYGCKIPPTDIEKVVFQLPELARVYNSFRMVTHEDEKHDKHLTVHIELAQGVEVPADVEAFRVAVFAALEVCNQDYRESSRIAAQKGITPRLEFHRFREGPFVGRDIRLKNDYTGTSLAK